MAWTQGDLDTLDKAIASNVRRVTYADGRSVEYHSASEMLQVRSQMKTELAAAASQTRPITRATRGRMVR